MLSLTFELVFVLLVTLAASIAALWMFAPAGHPWVLIAGLTAFSFYAPIRMTIAAVRARRRLDAHEWMLCPKCNHDLRGLEDDPLICPECGREWSTNQIWTSWEMFIRHKPQRR